MKTSPNLLLLISIFGLIVATSCKEVSSKFGASGELLNIDQLIAEDPGGLPVELFFDNQKQTNYTVSPDGKYIAWLAPWNEERNIFVRNLSNGKESRLTEESGADLRHYFWANHHKILFLKDRDGNEQYRLFSADIYTGEIKDLTPFDNVQIEIVSELPDKEDELIISMNKRNPRLFEPYKLNIETGEMVRLAENRNLKEPITWWMTDHNGELRVALSVTDGTHLNLLYRDKVSDPFKKLLTTDWTEYMHPLFFDFDNHYLYASSNLNRDCAAIVRFDPHSAKEVETIFEHEDVDVYDMGFSRGRQKLTWVGYAHDKWQINFLDSAASRLYRRVKYRLCDLEVANVEVKIPSIDKEERIFIIRTYTDRSLGAWYLYDRVTDRLEKLGDVNSNIDDQQMAEMEPISYQTRDGVTIHGYLTKPNVSTSKPLPVIVLPHGGPRNRDYWGFNAEVQFLASRGYAVLQTNYRGSIGYGRAFASAGFGQWGGIIQDDITDGVLWLIEQGLAD
ncbi:MAG: dipeptidyl aminopeptidase/acylaminoacyl peptidase, partial [Limisphaerales bacterium]